MFIFIIFKEACTAHSGQSATAERSARAEESLQQQGSLQILDDDDGINVDDDDGSISKSD